jgi:hypothetical protein
VREGIDPIDDYDRHALRRTDNSVWVDHLDLVHFMSLIMRRRESLCDSFKAQMAGKHPAEFFAEFIGNPDAVIDPEDNKNLNSLK